MDIIHLLPDSVANQIAAGEVIQRPASCLKELVENSLDAGAANIQILVRDAGRTLLQVIDDGKGMSETDARMAFERHATSKIKDAHDLFALRTMGFRGEALASVAAVAQVELLTRREEDEMATYLEIEGSSVLRQELTSGAKGTSIKVKNLFFNVPARRRFLKTNATELRNLLTDFYRIALVYPQVHFLFVNDDEVMFDLPAASTKQRIEAVFGKSLRKNYAGQLVEVKAETPLVSVAGFIGKPEAASKSPQQYFFVNGRFMKHPYFHKAVMTAYAGMLPPDHSPSYFIYFSVQPDSIDVNIHPTKTEIKFADEQPVWQILQATIRESLGKFNLVPSLDFNREGDIDIPSLPSNERLIAPPVVNVNTDYNPFMRSHDVSYREPVKNWERIYAPLQGHGQLSLLDEEQDTALRQPSVAYQYKENYLLCPVEDGLVLIDKRRAYAAVFYDMVLRQIHNKQGMKQQVLFPEILDFSSEDTQTLLEIQQQLDAAGYEITRVGPDSFAVNAVPASLDASLASRSLVNILQAVGALTATAQEQWEQTIASSLANDMAANCGKLLTDNEVQSLLGKLFALSDHTYTPDGKKIMCLIADTDLCKQLQ